MASPYTHHPDAAGEPSSPYDAAPSPYAEYANYADEHQQQHASAVGGTGHAPELSTSFYNEAAAALAGPAARASPFAAAAAATNEQGRASPLQANLTSLLQSPYAIHAHAHAHAQQSSTPNPFEEPLPDARQMNMPMISPGSMYDDKTEVDHTPMPALGYAYTPRQEGPFADRAAAAAGANADMVMDREMDMDGRGYAGGYDYAHSGPYDQVGGGGGDAGGLYGEKEEMHYAGSDYDYAEEERRLDAADLEGGDEERGMMRHGLNYEGLHYSSDQHVFAADGATETGIAPAETMHFGPAPARGAQLRRNKTRKAVKLTQGNLVLDCPVPTKLQSFLTRRGEEEFTTMRYTAVTCDPDDFAAQHFNLRPAMYNRHTEIHIAVTMYNEDEILFTRTLHGVMKNIAHLCSRHKSRTWGAEGWKKVVVTIIADGRKKIHPRVLDCLAALGVYQEGVAKNTVNGKQVQAHVYEYTTQLSIDSNLQFKGAERGLVPTQLIFCMKEQNQKKINSHRWFFNAFGPVLQPNVCILLDVGTRPEAKSIYYLWKTFDLNSNVAGACGEIQADTRGRWGLGPALLNPLVAAQNFEYKISNILDKTTESVFGFISVLPGAFSAYRYIALQNDELGRGPLASYFKGETMKQAEVTFSHANMYLAEDRILCFELAAKRNDRWVLRYVKSAKGVTDVPDSLAELISQRRRWLNGSFFAAIYSMTHTLQFGESGHGFWRKCCLYAEALYSTVNLIFAWLSLGNFYIFFRLLTTSLESKEFGLKGIGILNTGAQYVYLGTTISCFILALGNRPQGSPWKFFAAAVIYAILTLYMMVAAVLCLVKAVKNSQHDAIYSQMVFSVLATYGVYLLSSIIALDPLHLITSFVQYLLLAPSYVNILNTYAFSNLHDFSWGTKGISTDANDLGAVVATGKGTVEVILPTAQADIDLVYDKALSNLRTRPMIIRGDASAEAKAEVRLDFFRDLRTSVLLLWSLSNGVLAAFILGGDNVGTFDPGSGTTRSKVYMIVVLVFIGAMSVVRFGMSTIFMIHRLLVG